MTQAEELVGMAEAVRITGLSASTLRRAAGDGRIGYAKTPGGWRRFYRRDLEWIALPQTQITSEEVSSR